MHVSLYYIQYSNLWCLTVSGGFSELSWCFLVKPTDRQIRQYKQAYKQMGLA